MGLDEPQTATERGRDVLAEWCYNEQMEITDCPWDKLSDKHKERHRRWYGDTGLTALHDAGLVIVERDGAVAAREELAGYHREFPAVSKFLLSIAPYPEATP